jgi:hypothetical protein
MKAQTIPLASLLLLSLACSDPIALESRGGVAVSFATQPSAAASSPFRHATAPVLDDTLTAGSDTLIITRARLVLREIELKKVEATDCDVEPEPEGCEEVEVGPVLVDLPLVGGTQQAFEVELPAGTYERIDFEIHKVGDDPADLAFLAQHPTFEDISIRVEGSFNGSVFTFETDVNDEQEIDLVPPMALAEGGNTNVTIFVDIGGWFRTGAGALIDPASANKGGPNESVVTENIKQSLDAFEDPDGDGNDD